METLGIYIATAFITFTVTNIDDFGMLLIYFARAKSNQNMTTFNVYLGQFIGFTIICLLSMLGILLELFISAKYLALLGFVPLFIGLKGVYSLYYEKSEEEGTQSDYDYKLLKKTDEEGLEHSKEEEPFLKRICSNTLKVILNPQALEVALVTIGNGGDNISIYMPLFATSSFEMTIVTIIVFYLLLFVWLLFTSNIVGIKVVLEFLEKYQKYLIPIVFIGLGFYILSDSILYDMIFGANSIQGSKVGFIINDDI
jgi:cadmium resistance protein CadD (predicted permease)